MYILITVDGNSSSYVILFLQWRGPSAHLLSGAHVVLAEQAADALREGVDRAAVAVLLGAAAAPRPLRDFSLSPQIFTCSSFGKESACNAGDLGSIPGL